MFFSRLRRCFSQKPSPYTPTSPPVRMEEKTSWTRGIDHQKEDISWGNNEEKSSVAMYRIENELKSMNEEVATHCSFGPVGDDIFRWEGVVIGPAGSCYEGGIFHVSIQFPSDYPFTPPSINFLTKIFHPNVEVDGSIGMDILNENWSSALTIEKLLLSICSILSNPIPHGSTNEASTMFLNNWLDFNDTAKQWTKLYAMPN
ncbi:ubiquitin-conjugating enzyme E2 5A [Cucumis sativus]|uniref:UBC core domain-containing protein n=1 Tax=Cucumis sativus TaxID=3659 RepID=A0A0A0LI75_CUCSA|nr:ubiquitin-conjugating enzyme E2 5A [Cucumis sativus]